MPIIHLKDSAGVITEHTVTLPLPRTLTGIPAGVYTFTEGLTERTVTVAAPSAGQRTALVDMKIAAFGTTALPANWNQFLNTVASINLIDTTGAPMGLTMTRTEPVSYPVSSAPGAGTNTGSNSGAYPDEVIKTYWFTDRTVPAIGSIHRIKIGGFNPGETATVKVFGGRATSTARLGQYACGGKSGTLNAANNTANVLALAGCVADANGEMELTHEGANGGTYSYLNVVEIIRG